MNCWLCGLIEIKEVHLKVVLNLIFTLQKLLEGLQEMNEHIEARVKTLEALCAKEAEPKFKLGSNLSSRQSVASRTTEP